LTRAYSLETYKSIMRLALLAGYYIAPFSLPPSNAGRRIYLRHDVDYSLEMALRLAEVNAELGIQGTFCVLLRSQIYNLLSDRSLSALEKIAALGQNLGLHGSVPPALPDDNAVESRIRADFECVRYNCAVVSAVCSWHNPTAEVLERYLGRSTVGGLVNVYSESFVREIPYYSDSNMRHSVEDFMRLVGDDGAPCMQLLLHPLNWVAGGQSMRDVFSGTWPYVIREREVDMRENRFYACALPDGMPDSVVRGFVKEWRRSTGDDRS
jgi:hypothetical protein